MQHMQVGVFESHGWTGSVVSEASEGSDRERCERRAHRHNTCQMDASNMLHKMRPTTLRT